METPNEKMSADWMEKNEVCCHKDIPRVKIHASRVREGITMMTNADTPQEPDMINNPPHYTQGEIECIDAIEASMSPEEFKGFLKGMVLKYVWRYKMKWNPKQDIQKAMWYLKRLERKL